MHEHMLHLLHAFISYRVYKQMIPLFLSFDMNSLTPFHFLSEDKSTACAFVRVFLTGNEISLHLALCCREILL